MISVWRSSFNWACKFSRKRLPCETTLRAMKTANSRRKIAVKTWTLPSASDSDAAEAQVMVQI